MRFTGFLPTSLCPASPTTRGRRRYTKTVVFRAAVLTPVCLFLLAFSACQQATSTFAVPDSPPDDRLKQAVLRVEEDRGQPTGRKARVEVPVALKHYADRRRFLAMQSAAWQEWRFEIPQSYVELVELIEKGGFVEMEPLGETHILYGAGENATTARFTHFDRATGKAVPLLADDEEFTAERQRLIEVISRKESQKVDLQIQLSQMPQTAKIARAARRVLLARLTALEAENKAAAEDLSRLEYFYRDAVRATMLFSRHRWLKNVAASFHGESYDISDPTERRRFKMRLLAFTRPRTRRVIEEIARAYYGRFGRHLPVTSLFRTIEYQRQLREVNPNATGADIAPHTTGLAFDVYDRYMTGEEQQFLMEVIASMKAQGRVEALRENRDHIHIFAFPNGKPPNEKLIAKVLKQDYSGTRSERLRK